MEPLEVLARSRALWNRKQLDLESDETMAQILDRGSREDWRALYQLCSGGGEEAQGLRERIHRIIYRADIAYPWFWLAVLSGLGCPVDWSREPKVPGEAAI